MAQPKAIRVPDDLHAAIKAEAEKRGHPHSFSSVLIEWAKVGHAAAKRKAAKKP